MHIFVRFDLERELIAERLKVLELPEAWNEKMKAYLGVVPATDAQGVLQDIHWSGGSFGYFPTYTLGNVLSVQFYEHVHRYGSMYPPMELVRRVTGRELDSRPYLTYLTTKYTEIYGL